MAIAGHREGVCVAMPGGGAAIDPEVLPGLWTEVQYLRLTGGDMRVESACLGGSSVSVAEVFDAD